MAAICTVLCVFCFFFILQFDLFIWHVSSIMWAIVTLSLKPTSLLTYFPLPLPSHSPIIICPHCHCIYLSFCIYIPLNSDTYPVSPDGVRPLTKNLSPPQKLRAEPNEKQHSHKVGRVLIHLVPGSPKLNGASHDWHRVIAPIGLAPAVI